LAGYRIGEIRVELRRKKPRLGNIVIANLKTLLALAKSAAIFLGTR